MTSTIDIRKKKAKERNLASRDSSLKQYEEKQAEIKKLLKQIQAGLEKHDRKASGEGGHNWGHVGDLNYIEEQLTEARDFLMGTGEYQR